MTKPCPKQAQENPDSWNYINFPISTQMLLGFFDLQNVNCGRKGQYFPQLGWPRLVTQAAEIFQTIFAAATFCLTSLRAVISWSKFARPLSYLIFAWDAHYLIQQKLLMPTFAAAECLLHLMIFTKKLLLAPIKVLSEDLWPMITIPSRHPQRAFKTTSHELRWTKMN